MRPTNPLWYLAAFLVAIGSAMIATAVAASAFDEVRDARVTPVSERVDAAGTTLAVFSNDAEHGEIACYGRGLDKQRVDIPAKDVGVTTESEGETWYLIAVLEDGRDDLRIVCKPESERPDTAGYSYATVDGYAGAVNNGQGIAILGVSAGAAGAAWVFWCRRSAKKDARSARAASPPGD